MDKNKHDNDDERWTNSARDIASTDGKWQLFIKISLVVARGQKYEAPGKNRTQ